MLFRLCEHYEHNFPIYKQNTINECFICFEYKNDDGFLPIYLKTQNLYLNGCLCNGSVHNECLKIWFNKNKSCPICRIKVIENNNTTIIIYNYIPFGINIYTYTKKLVPEVVRVFSCVLLIFLILDFYFMIDNTKYRQYNDGGYNVYTHTLSPILDNEYIE
jgi:hypothetical protein